MERTHREPSSVSTSTSSTRTSSSLSASTSTPRRPPTGTTYSSANPLATPRRPPLPGAPSTLLTTSPHYTTSLRSRHSLYGTEDRIILDLGSAIWKVGFSGEPSPRECIDVLGEEGQPIWGLEKGEVGETEWKIREERLKRLLRQVWFTHLMSDPKARKVIILEPPLMSIRIKELFAKVLFENLQVPSINFASSHLLALIAVGRTSGLVVDVGNLETTVLPISSSRPLFPHLLTTPLSSTQILHRLRNLLLKYGSYIPPPPSLNNTVPTRIIKGIPENVLSWTLTREVLNRVCFVSERVAEEEEGEGMQVDESSTTEEIQYPNGDTSASLNAIHRHFSKKSKATSLTIRIPTNTNGNASASASGGTGKGHIHVPGWVREFASEILWEKGDDDGRSLVEVALECLKKLPIDLRKPMASSILVIGGVAMLPGFFPRFRNELLRTLEVSKPSSPPPSPPALPSSEAENAVESLRRKKHQALATRLSSFRSLRNTPYASLIPLINNIAILNDPSESSSFTSASSDQIIPLHSNNGCAPNFSPALTAWIGGSLAGALKIGGKEILRETWEKGSVLGTTGDEGLGITGAGTEMDVEEGEEEEAEEEEDGRKRRLIGDWSRERIVKGL